MSREETCFAVVAPGLERVALEEARGHLVSKVSAVPGGLEIEGGLEAGMRACLWLRCATTVRARLGRFQAQDRRRLNEGLSHIDWARWLPPGERPAVSCTSRKSRLNHTGMLSETVAAAVGREIISGSNGVHVRLERDVAEISIDLSGERLHVRGWRKEGGRAPLRETLAAAIVQLTGWTTREWLIDPMCGSGTLPIEASLIARNIAPGLLREFAFQQMPRFEQASWDRLLDEARAAIRADVSPLVMGADRHRGAVASASRNARRAGLAPGMFERADVSMLTPPDGARGGVLVTNPPYGRRIGESRAEILEAYRSLGETIARSFSGWRAFALAPSRELIEATGLAADDGLPLDNGGIRVRLYRLS